jgi:hypothetical protein
MHWTANGSSLGNIPALRAVKVRGREYLRIIYGPEYIARTLEEA